MPTTLDARDIWFREIRTMSSMRSYGNEKEEKRLQQRHLPGAGASFCLLAVSAES